MRARGSALALAALCVLAAALSVLVRLSLFPDGSLNNDETVYLLQAKGLIEGQLLLPTTAPVEALQPWFFAISPDGYVGKYLPLVPALYAVGLVLTDSVVPVLAVLAGIVPLMVHRLGREAGLTDRQALTAAALVSLSPAVLVQTGLTLSYLPFLVLLLTGWLLLLRLGHGAPPGRTAFGAAAAGSAAACARPLDAVLLLLVPAAWAAVRLVGSRRGRGRAAAGACLGGLPVLLTVLTYNAKATGSPLRLPFALLEPLDRLGFGGRKLFPEDRLHSFGPRESAEGAFAHFVVGPFWWFALSPLLAALLLLALRRGTLAPAVRLLLASCGLFLAGYLAFWGPYNVSVLWGGTRVVGPFYAIPLLVPLVLAAVPSLHVQAVARPRLVVPLILLAAVPTVVQSVAGVQQARIDASRTALVLAVAQGAKDSGPLLLDADPPYLGHPVSGLVNDPGARGWPLLLASQVDPALVPPRAQLLQLPRDPYRPGRPLSYSLRDQVPVTGARVAVEVRRAGGDPAEILVLERGGTTRACRAGTSASLVLREDTWSSDCDGSPVPAGWTTEPYRRCLDSSCLAVATYERRPSGALVRTAWRRLAVGQAAGSVSTLLDGRSRSASGGGWLVLAPGSDSALR